MNMVVYNKVSIISKVSILDTLNRLANI